MSYHRALRLAAGIPFFADCIEWPEKYFPALSHIGTAPGIRIPWSDFEAAVDIGSLGFEPPADSYPAYRVPGFDIYWFVQDDAPFESEYDEDGQAEQDVEYVFAREVDIRALTEQALG